MKIAVAHEWLVRYAGSERVVDELLAAFPDADLLTTVIEPRALPPRLGRGRPSVLQRIPGATSHHEILLPLMPLSWRLRRPIAGVDAVVSSNHACAKAVRIEAGIPHLCYCHTPMRYAWDFESEQARFPAAITAPARLGMAWFRDWDRRVADNVDVFVANSSAVRDRIMACYGRRATVIHPPVRTDKFTPGGERGNAFLYVGRLVPYKRADLVVEAFAGLDERLIVVGQGTLGTGLKARATDNVTFLDEVDEENLIDLYRTTRAIVFPAEEDFGIAMAEAQACGTPVIGLDRGGARDIVEHGVTGWLLDAPTVDRVRDAVRRATREELDPAEIRRRAERFSTDRFRSEMVAAIEAMVEIAHSPDGFDRLRRLGLD